MAGKFKTKRPLDSKLIRRANQKANHFAAGFTPRAIDQLLSETGFDRDLYEANLTNHAHEEAHLSLDQFRLKIVQDLMQPFGRLIAMAYALGAVDEIEQRSVKDLERMVQGPLDESDTLPPEAAKDALD